MKKNSNGKVSTQRRTTYVGDPSKDIGIEADMVFTDIESPLNEDLFLESATVIYFRFLSTREQRRGTEG